MKYKLTIPGLLPGLNEYIDAERSHKGKYKAASMKRQAQNVIGYMIRTQLRGVRFTRPVVIRYDRTDPEPNPNNFAFSSLRYDLNTDFLDALNDAGVIPADKVLEAEWSLADHDGTNRYGVAVCKIAMLPEPLVRKYYDAGLLEIEDWEWTITPYAGNAYSVRHVYSVGYLDYGNAWYGDYGVRPAFFVDSEICLFLEPDEVELSDAALLREFTSKQLADEVLRRIAAGEDDEDE